MSVFFILKPMGLDASFYGAVLEEHNVLPISDAEKGLETQAIIHSYFDQDHNNLSWSVLLEDINSYCSEFLSEQQYYVYVDMTDVVSYSHFEDFDFDYKVMALNSRPEVCSDLLGKPFDAALWCQMTDEMLEIVFANTDNCILIDFLEAQSNVSRLYKVIGEKLKISRLDGFGDFLGCDSGLVDISDQINVLIFISDDQGVDISYQSFYAASCMISKDCDLGVRERLRHLVIKQQQEFKGIVSTSQAKSDYQSAKILELQEALDDKGIEVELGQEAIAAVNDRHEKSLISLEQLSKENELLRGDASKLLAEFNDCNSRLILNHEELHDLMDAYESDQQNIKSLGSDKDEMQQSLVRADERYRECNSHKELAEIQVVTLQDEIEASINHNNQLEGDFAEYKDEVALEMSKLSNELIETVDIVHECQINKQGLDDRIQELLLRNDVSKHAHDLLLDQNNEMDIQLELNGLHLAKLQEEADQYYLKYIEERDQNKMSVLAGSVFGVDSYLLSVACDLMPESRQA